MSTLLWLCKEHAPYCLKLKIKTDELRIEDLPFSNKFHQLVSTVNACIYIKSHFMFFHPLVRYVKLHHICSECLINLRGNTGTMSHLWVCVFVCVLVWVSERVREKGEGGWKRVSSVCLKVNRYRCFILPLMTHNGTLVKWQGERESLCVCVCVHAYVFYRRSLEDIS